MLTKLNIKESNLKAIMWSLIVGLLAAIVWLTIDHAAQVGKLVSRSAQVVADEMKLPSPPFSLSQFGALSQPTTILFLGTDVVYSNTRRRAQSEPGSCQGNSDTMMLVFLNPVHNTVSVLNIPRDTEACIGKWGVRKINSANPLGGPELARQAVSSLLDVRIDHYAVMNLQGLVEMVNELGGITVEVPKKMNYMDWTAKLKIDLQPGFHTLTGNQSMGFVRFRHDALGDIGRIQRQQIFLQAAVRKMLVPASWLHLNALMQIAQRSIQTDMSTVDLLEALNFAHGVPRENTKFVMLPGDFGGNGDWLANTDSKALAQRLANPDQETVSSRRNITVCVVNAGSDRLLGSKLTRALRKLGYVTYLGRDENEPVSGTTRIIAQNGNTANADMLRHDLGNRGEVVNASVGNLLSSITIVAHDDIKLDEIAMSCPDAPYVAPPPPQPLVVRAWTAPSRRAGSAESQEVPAVEEGTAGVADGRQPTGELSRQDNLKTTAEDNLKTTGGDNATVTGEDDWKITGGDNVKMTGKDNLRMTGKPDEKPTGEYTPALPGDAAEAHAIPEHSDAAPEHASDASVKMLLVP